MSKNRAGWQELLETSSRGLYSGAALGIAKVGKETEQTFVGHISPAPKSPKVGENTLFDLSSLTKVFLTTTVVARLVSAQRLSLNEKMVEILPHLSWDEAWKNLQIREILCHMAGFLAWEDFSKQEKPEILNSIARSKPLATFREKVIYSDLGFILLAEALAQKTKKDFKQLCQQEVIEPLGLKRMLPSPLLAKKNQTSTAKTEKSSVDEAWIHVNDANARALGGVSGHAGYFANLGSCMKIAEAWISSLRGDESFLSPNVSQEFASICESADGERRALGWDVPTFPNSSAGTFISKSSLGHLGFTGTSVWMDLEREAWVVLLTNRTVMGSTKEEMRRFRSALHDEIWSYLDQ